LKKRTKLYVVLACLAVAGITSLIIYLNTKGVPAVNVSAYVESASEPVQAEQLAFLPDSSNAVPGMKLVAQTEQLGLYYHEETTEIAVLDRASGKVWRSNPADRDEDPKASPFEKEVMSSQFSILFRDELGRGTTFSNYAESIARGQFTAESIENGLRITYTLGDMSLGIDALPKLISKQRMEEKVLSKLDDQTKVTINRGYLPSDANPDILERLDAAVSRELVLKRMLAAFETAGYTAEDLAFDNEENGIASSGASDRPTFTIPIEYRLEGDSLSAKIAVGQIEESAGYRIRMINLLSFFGAAGGDEQGYMLVPDGTGSLIYLNNGKIKDEVYAQRVYGDDQNDNSGRRGQVAQSARLPVFGLKSGDHAWFAEIDRGEAIAGINADINGRNNSYNNLFASFAIRGEDWLELYKGTTVEEIQLLTDERFEGDIQVRYSFLSGEEADYSGMAKLYRSHLEQEGVLKPLEDEGELPFYLSMLGAVDKRKSFLGIPYKGLIAMTTFDEAGDIADKLKADGISNVQMRYQGWFNKGLNHRAPAKVKADSLLGGNSGIRELADKLEAMGGKLYPDVAFQHVSRDDGSFSPSADAARFVTREEAMRTPYNRAFNTMDYDLGTFYLLSPAKLPYYVNKFVGSYGKLDHDAVSLRDLGGLLHADYRTSRTVFRDTAKHIVTEQLGKLEEAYPNILASGGNAYALRYADHLVEVPMSSSKFNITDEEVPFYQLVLHGYKDYAGSPVNLSDDQDLQSQLLRAIELGAAPHFLWSHDASSKLKFTAYDVMFSTEYTAWYDQAVDMYKQASEVLSGLRAQRIDEHIRHEQGVVEVKYENGVSVYVNYTDRPVTVNGIAIAAQNYTVGGENK